MKDPAGFARLMVLVAIFLYLFNITNRLRQPAASTAPCNGQIITGLVGGIEVRLCLHPTTR